MTRRWARTAGLVAAAALAATGAALWRDPARRDRLVRTVRVGRLTARRAGGYTLTRVRGLAASQVGDHDRRRRLDEAYLIRSAEDVTRELGQMKGALMKAGQMLSYQIDGLPEEARRSLESLQQAAPAMAPSLAADTVRAELGADPLELFLDWEAEPVAAASIGQVHRAVLRDGRRVAVKVQYPGIDHALEGDLANARLLSAMFSAVALKRLDVDAFVAEIRARMLDELDYRLEADCQREFAARYAGHPFIHVPAVIDEHSTGRVLTTEWAEGDDWDGFRARADADERQRAAEILFRFAQGSVYRARVFNGDPHPGNYRFGSDGRVSFLDFGMVKRWRPGEFERLLPLIDPLLSGEAEQLVQLMVDVRFLAADHGLDPQLVWEYVSRPYLPYLTDEYTFRPEFTTETLTRLLARDGPYAEVANRLDMPASFVVLDRVVWGVSALLGHLGAHNRWRAIFDEYRLDTPPATELGRQEAMWAAEVRPGRGD